MRKMMGKVGKNFGGLINRIPGLNKLTGGGGMPDPSQLAQMAGLDNQTVSAPKKIDRAKLKKNRKSARQNRKRNRRR